MQKAKEGLGTTLMLSEEEYNTVKENIRVATKISDVIDLYEKAMSGRITKDEYNFLAEQTSAIDEIDAHVDECKTTLASKNHTSWNTETDAWKNYNKPVTLDDVLQAKLDNVIADAKKTVNDVKVKNGNYVTALEAISNAVDGGKEAITEIFEFAVEKTVRIKSYDDKYDELVTALEKLFEDNDDTELNAVKAELTKLYNDGKEGLNASTTHEECDEAMQDALNIQTYYDLVKAKCDAKGVLDNTYAFYVKDESKYMYLSQMKDALKAGKASIDSATVKGSAETDRGSVMKAEDDAKKAMYNVNELETAAQTVKSRIEKYINTIKDEVVPDSTVKYVDAIKTNIDEEIAHLSTFTKKADITAYEETAETNILNALKAYMKTTLNTLANKTTSDNNVKVLTLACYIKLQDNLKAIDELKFSSSLKTDIIDEFVGSGKMVELKELSALKAEMATTFNDTMVTKATDKGLGKGPDSKVKTALSSASKYADLAEVKAILDTVPDRFANVTSAKDYEGIAGSNDSQGLRNALLVALRTKLANVLSSNDGKPADVTNVRNATTIENAISLFEANFPQD